MPLRDVRSQDATVTALQRAWSSGKLHHACLLTGPSGVGKTMVAREAARLLLCDEPTDDVDACGRCRSCHLFDRGAHPDLVTVDVAEGKKLIAVSQIREVRGRLEYPPHRDRGRAVIFEKAEQMTIEAQNALLKTLEEPPERTYLFLTTSHAAQLLPTIRSRCSELHMASLPTPVVLDLLRLQMTEGDEKLITLAASLSSGSVTSALHLVEVDLEALGEMVAKLDGALERKQVPEAMDVVEELCRDKERLMTSLQLLALWYRDVMYQASGRIDQEPAAGGEMAYTHRAGDVARRAQQIGVSGACDHLGATMDAVEAIGARNANPRLTAEAMVLRMLS